MDLFSYLSSKQTPEKQLQDAVTNNRVDKLDDIVDRVSDINVKLHEYGGNTAMHIAATNGYFRCLEKLLKAGADPELRNDFGQTPLFLAMRKYRGEAVEVLLRETSEIKDIETLWLKQEWSSAIWQKGNDAVTAVLLKATPDLSSTRSNLQSNLFSLCIRFGLLKSLKIWVLTGNSFSSDQLSKFDVNSEVDKAFLDWVKRYTRTVQPLSHYCRLTIRRSMQGKCNTMFGSQHLPLPRTLKDYIFYRHERLQIEESDKVSTLEENDTVST